MQHACGKVKRPDYSTKGALNGNPKEPGSKNRLPEDDLVLACPTLLIHVIGWPINIYMLRR
jgi:hypothetical protein